MPKALPGFLQNRDLGELIAARLSEVSQPSAPRAPRAAGEHGPDPIPVDDPSPTEVALRAVFASAAEEIRTYVGPAGS